jgi:hypothetical protein
VLQIKNFAAFCKKKKKKKLFKTFSHIPMIFNNAEEEYLEHKNNIFIFLQYTAI